MNAYEISPVILDEEGVPYSADRFLTEPQSAHDFLEQIERNSVGLVSQWRDMTHDKIIQEAQYRLHGMSRDLENAYHLRAKDRLQ